MDKPGFARIERWIADDAFVPLAQRVERTKFLSLVVYYAMALYLLPSSAKVEPRSLTYFALILPAWGYVLANWRHLLHGYSAAAASMAAFAAMASAAGLLRGDFALAYNAIFMSAVGIIILNARVYVTLSELNLIFFGCIGGSVIVYLLGATDYGFLPGQADGSGCHAALSWRISLFRVTAESAMFCLLVLIANIAYGNSVRPYIRGAAIFLAAYFLIFSGIRSIVVSAIVVLPWCVLAWLKAQAPAARVKTLAASVCGAMVILTTPYWLGEPMLRFWKNYALRSDDCAFRVRYYGPKGVPSGDSEEVSSTIPSDWYFATLNRHCAAKYQLTLVAAFPFGTRDVRPQSESELSSVGCAPDELPRYCTSCTFATYWLARSGITAIPLFLTFAVLLYSALRRRRTALALTLLANAIASLGWGVMFVPYNFIYMLMLMQPAIAAAYEREDKAK